MRLKRKNHGFLTQNGPDGDKKKAIDYTVCGIPKKCVCENKKTGKFGGLV